MGHYALLSVLWANPDALEAFGHDCFYYYHLNSHADFVDRQIAADLASSPAPHAVLDLVIQDAGPSASPLTLQIVRKRPKDPDDRGATGATRHSAALIESLP